MSLALLLCIIDKLYYTFHQAIRIKNPAIITAENIADIPPELVDTDAIELVSNIGREYALKFEQVSHLLSYINCIRF